MDFRRLPVTMGMRMLFVRAVVMMIMAVSMSMMGMAYEDQSNEIDYQASDTHC